MKICLTVPERFAAQAELPALLREPADLTLFPEGFLRSQEDLDLALRLAVLAVGGFAVMTVGGRRQKGKPTEKD